MLDDDSESEAMDVGLDCWTNEQIFLRLAELTQKSALVRIIPQGLDADLERCMLDILAKIRLRHSPPPKNFWRALQNRLASLGRTTKIALRRIANVV